MSGPRQEDFEGCFYVAIEGLDGSGKTTQAELLQKALLSAGLVFGPSHDTEPTDSVVGRLIRNALAGRVDLQETTMAVLFAADRVLHRSELEKQMRYMVERGKKCVFICDRGLMSSLAYQASSPAKMLAIRKMNMDARVPDLNVVISVSPVEAMRRIAQRKGEPERYEEISLQERVDYMYRLIPDKFRNVGPVVFVNGEQLPQDVHRSVLSVLRCLPIDWPSLGSSDD